MDPSKLKDRAFVEEYFANMNEISRRISLDIGEIKATYEHIWDDLSREEQSEIINETLIKPELTLKYFDSFSTSDDSFRNIIVDEDNSDDRKVNLYDGKSLHTFQFQKTGRKVIHDESVGLYRDEHSGPFAHKTKSQINLNIFPLEKEKPAEPRRVDLGKKLDKVKSPKLADGAKAGKTATSKMTSSQISYVDTENNVVLPPAKPEPVVAPEFLASFICSQSGPGGPTLIAASAAVATSLGSDEVDGQSLENLGFDDDKINLFRHSSRSDSLHQAQSSSVEEDDKNFDELNSLLGNSKGFDFLNNW
ncbi:uncharacterized protein LOC6045622 [Culex quinquefasciatus]|uniref:uncharacterized protein LOC6045622 n=1 Tax=Culex quinquefasciatus TaxID=7176 RepID=UPI0018E3EBD3|nr:uncharacterized protein LOC6045622 [Culex quinquefasciatus]XP_038104538.1 uncharacterized protein LOC6045622 [Culex quinquefasciatus]